MNIVDALNHLFPLPHSADCGCRICARYGPALHESDIIRDSDHTENIRLRHPQPRPPQAAGPPAARGLAPLTLGADGVWTAVDTGRDLTIMVDASDLLVEEDSDAFAAWCGKMYVAFWARRGRIWPVEEHPH